MYNIKRKNEWSHPEVFYTIPKFINQRRFCEQCKYLMGYTRFYVPGVARIEQNNFYRSLAWTIESIRIQHWKQHDLLTKQKKNPLPSGQRISVLAKIAITKVGET